VKVWDTSAFLSILLRQQATDELKALLVSDGGLAVWWGTKVEAVSAVCRLRRAAEIEERAASRLFREIEKLAAAAYEVQPSEALRDIACRALRVHELRAADASSLLRDWCGRTTVPLPVGLSALSGGSGQPRTKRVLTFCLSDHPHPDKGRGVPTFRGHTRPRGSLANRRRSAYNLDDQRRRAVAASRLLHNRHERDKGASAKPRFHASRWALRSE